MSDFIFRAIEATAKIIRGNDYRLDRKIPVKYLIHLAADKSISILRAMASGHSIRRRLFLGKNVTIHNKKMLFLGKGIVIGESSYIDALSQEGIHIGNNVSIGAHSRIEASGTISNIGIGIKIGNNTGIGAFCFIGGAGGVSIGSDVIMGQWVSFHPENHNIEDLDIPIRLQGVNRQGITVEDDCWIGAKATFLDGAHVGRGCVIAAGAVVRGVIPPYSIAGGVPAKVIRSRVNPSAHDPKHPVPPSIG
jgi:acetyltransferase-like isoleucine patch superfamily enzyme